MVQWNPSEFDIEWKLDILDSKNKTKMFVQTVIRTHARVVHGEHTDTYAILPPGKGEKS